jgi:hypothetical protein
MTSRAHRPVDVRYPWPRISAVRLRPMTIREYFRRRSRRARRVLGVGSVVAAVAVGIFALTASLTPRYPYVLVAAGVLGAAIMFGALLYLDHTKCPNCLGRLGIQIANQYRLGRRIAFCPFCGVGFDKCEVRSP